MWAWVLPANAPGTYLVEKVPDYGSQLDEIKKYDDSSNVHACESVRKSTERTALEIESGEGSRHTGNCPVNQVLN